MYHGEAPLVCLSHPEPTKSSDAMRARTAALLCTARELDWGHGLVGGSAGCLVSKTWLPDVPDAADLDAIDMG